MLVTSEAFYRRKIEPWRKELAEPGACLPDRLLGQPAARHDRSGGRHGGGVGFVRDRVDRRPKTWRLLHFTSGTTGRPKGAVHVHEAVVAHHITGRLALDLHPDDVFWCTADPGWVTGTSYGIISPLTNGATLIVDQAEFDAERWYRILQDQKVTVWYTAPTAIRMLMKVGRRGRQAVRPVQPALHGERRRAAQSRGRGLGRRGVRQAVPRQLVADRDRRHHDRQLPVDGREAGIDGPPAAGRHRRHRRARSQAGRCARSPNPWPWASLRCGPAGRR